ncbi:MAG: radical SAM protein [Candidatus Margulisbacteria bacterium]|nr:radical SAM protein [Candidatus Margulisiibacteriota bacterium]
MNNQKKIKKSVVLLGYSCNNKCIFCTFGHKGRDTFEPWLEVKRKIYQEKKNGSTYLELIGGEPTIYPAYIELVRYAKELKYNNIVSATNGRAIAYLDYARKLVEAGITELIFSIHGHEAWLHDKQTQVPGSFKQLIKGIKNLKKIGFKNISTNTTINTVNYKYLKNIGKFILNLGIVNSEFIFIDPNHWSKRENVKKMVPRISEAAFYMQDLLKLVKGKKEYSWRVRYVPLCFFTDFIEYISELRERTYFKSRHIAPDFINIDVESSRPIFGRAKGDQCKKCVINKWCEGLWNKYIETYGTSELKRINEIPQGLERYNKLKAS